MLTSEVGYYYNVAPKHSIRFLRMQYTIYSKEAYFYARILNWNTETTVERENGQLYLKSPEFLHTLG